MTAVPEDTVARFLAGRLADYGVRRIFGVPGGGASVPLIAAAAERGIDFVLARQETSAAIMASVTGELTGTPGAALVTKGPGIASAINGLAYALLDRAPAVVISEGFETDYAYMSHQFLDQEAMTRPVTKGRLRVDGAGDAVGFAALLDLALADPPGPVHLQLTPKGAKAGCALQQAPRQAPRNFDGGAPDEGAIARARALLAAARRPVLIAGLQAIRRPADAAALRALADDLGCPCFSTYKAKGFVADDDPRAIGLYVGGAGEAEYIGGADLILLFGADPVEFAIQPWRYRAPTIDVSRYPYDRHYLKPTVTVLGSLAAAADRLRGAHRKGAWTGAEMASMRARLGEKLAIRGGGPITAQHVVEAAAAAAPAGTRIAVDAGAHMIPVMAFWKAKAPNDVLISNGLATMGFALPAAIAASLHEPERPVIAFTGDGGLMMCQGELATAAQQGCRIAVVVFNDSALSLIALKQARMGHESRGVTFSEVDFAAAARAVGCAGWRVTEPGRLQGAIRDALAAGGPALVDAVVDPSGYLDQVKALRG